MRIGLAADHEGYELKEQILEALGKMPLQICDYGALNLNPQDDYPDFVIPLAKAIQDQDIDRGIAICGSGIGACIAANKIHRVRAGIIQDLFSARQGVEDDDMNVICLGARLLTLPLALELIQCFLSAQFSGAPRHQRRLAKIAKLEETEIRI